MGNASAESLDILATSERYSAAWAQRDPDVIASLHTPDTAQIQAALSGGVR
jgi:hypothetical protein